MAFISQLEIINSQLEMNSFSYLLVGLRQSLASHWSLATIRSTAAQPNDKGLMTNDIPQNGQGSSTAWCWNRMARPAAPTAGVKKSRKT